MAAHITVHESSFMNSPFLIPKAPLDIILLSDKIRKLGNGLSFHRVENESSFTIKLFMKEDAASVLYATRSLISQGPLDIIKGLFMKEDATIVLCATMSLISKGALDIRKVLFIKEAATSVLHATKSMIS